MKTELISSEHDLNEFAALLRRNGFTILTPKKPSTYFTFMKDSAFGHVSINHFKWLVDFGTVHKPSKENGTGFSVLREADRETSLTLDNANKTLAASCSMGRNVKRYTGIEDYMSIATNRILGNRAFAPIMLFETGATSHAVNDLVLFVDNTRELALVRDWVYREAIKYPHTAGETLSKGFEFNLLPKAIEQYMNEFAHDKSSYQHIVNMTESEKKEFCQLFAIEFKNWKKEHGIE
jgi:hypothetical protein